MIEAVNTRARGLRTHRAEGIEVASAVRRLDWVLLGAVGALLGYGLWSIGGITAHDITGNPNYYLVRQSVYAVVGCLGLVAVLFIDPDYYRRHRQPIFIGTAGVMLLVLLAGTVLAPLEALARHRLLPLPAVRVREAALRPVPGRLPRRPGAAARGDAHRRSRRSGSA